MAEKLKLADSYERVAYDLFVFIKQQADGEPGVQDRWHLLKLYNQCLAAVHGAKAEDIKASS